MMSRYVLWAIIIMAPALRSELQVVPVNGKALPPKTVVLTIDDAPYEFWQQGSPFFPSNWTVAIANYLATVQRKYTSGKVSVGVPAAWFLVTCHFKTQPSPALPPPASVACMGARDQNESLVAELVKLGFVVANHTHSHVPTSWLNDPTIPPGSPQPYRDTLFNYELCQPQQLLSQYQTDGFKFFRAPGLNWPDWAAGVANANACTAELDGPVDADVGGGFFIGPNQDDRMGGDSDCFYRGLSPQACGELYLRDIREVTKQHGAIVLLHNYVLPGWYAMALIQHIMEGLDPDIKVVDLRTHPAFQKAGR